MSDKEQLSEEDQYAAFLEAQNAPPEDKKPPKIEAEQAEPVESAEVEEPEADDNVNTAVEESEPFPGYNALPEDLRAAALAAFQERETKAQELDQRYRQQHGQLAPAQRKVSELEKQNTNLLKLVEELQNKQLNAAQTHSKNAFDQYKEQYPEEAAAIEARTNPLALQYQQTQEQLLAARQQIAEVQAEIKLQKNSAALVKIHPDAYEIVTDPVFNAWVGALDEDDQARANSDDPRAASKILDQFKRDRMLAELLESQKSQATPSRGKPKLDVDPPSRNRQSPAPARMGNASGSEEDEWAAWLESRKSA